MVKAAALNIFDLGTLKTYVMADSILLAGSGLFYFHGRINHPELQSPVDKQGGPVHEH